MILIKILGWACFGHLVVDLLQSLNIKLLERKPFNCEMCMTFWLSVLILGIPYAALAGVLADLIFRLKQRL